MLIEEATTQASLDLLARARLGRLACAQGSQPYVVPFYFAYHHNYLYSFTTVGQKVEWMRANPLVCVEVDEVVSTHKWMSVIVFGRYEELLDTPEWRSEREFASKLLQQHAMWWSLVIQRPLSTAQSVYYYRSSTAFTWPELPAAALALSRWCRLAQDCRWPTWAKAEG